MNCIAKLANHHTPSKHVTQHMRVASASQNCRVAAQNMRVVASNDLHSCTPSKHITQLKKVASASQDGRVVAEKSRVAAGNELHSRVASHFALGDDAGKPLRRGGWQSAISEPLRQGGQPSTLQRIPVWLLAENCIAEWLPTKHQASM